MKSAQTEMNRASIHTVHNYITFITNIVGGRRILFKTMDLVSTGFLPSCSTLFSYICLFTQAALATDIHKWSSTKSKINKNIMLR